MRSICGIYFCCGVVCLQINQQIRITSGWPLPHIVCWKAQQNSNVPIWKKQFFLCWSGPLSALLSNNWWCKVESADIERRLDVIVITANLLFVLCTTHHQLLPTRAGNGQDLPSFRMMSNLFSNSRIFVIFRMKEQHLTIQTIRSITWWLTAV